MSALYRDRRHAGAHLAQMLSDQVSEEPLLLALPRGGVPLAHEISKETGWPWDILLAKKLASREDPEFARGALAEGGEPIWSGDPPPGGEEIVRRAREAMVIRAEAWSHSLPSTKGKLVVVVDDGVATGWTALAAARALGEAREVWGAFPLAPKTSRSTLQAEYDRVVCPYWIERFAYVGQFYDNFLPVSDQEVEEALGIS